MGKRYLQIQEVELNSKNSIYAVVLPQGTRSYTIKTRGNSEVKLGIDSALSKYITYPSGTAESEDGIFSENPITFYIQAEQDNEILEVKYWVG